METKTVELLWWESRSFRFHKENRPMVTLTFHTTVRTSASVDWRSAEVRKYSFLLHISTGVHSSRKYLFHNGPIKHKRNTNLIPNTFMTMTTAEEGNHFYFGPQTGLVVPKNKLKITGIFREQELRTPHSLLWNYFPPMRWSHFFHGSVSKNTKHCNLHRKVWVSDEVKLDPQRAWKWKAMMKNQRIVRGYDCGDQLFNYILQSAIRG